MTSQAKIEANRRNAKKSTGPRTGKGKQHSRLNALKCGVFAQDPTLPCEDPRMFNDLTEQIREEVQPRDTFEELQVNEIARSIIRWVRLGIAEDGYWLREVASVTAWRVERERQSVAESREGAPNPVSTDYEPEDVEYALRRALNHHDNMDIIERVDARRRAILRDIDQRFEQIYKRRDRQRKVADAHVIKHIANDAA